MRYDHRDDTFTVTRASDDDLETEPQPEFRVRVSPVANGWWTREELTRLHARIGEALALPAAVPPEIRTALAMWAAAAENAHGGNARKAPLLTTAQLIEAGDKLAAILRDMTED
jgi:hypothetical protein